MRERGKGKGVAMTLTMIVAILMIVAIVALLLKGVMNAGLIFAGVSVIGALIMGFGFGDLNGFLKAGMNTWEARSS